MEQILTQTNLEEVYEDYLRKESNKNAVERYYGKSKWFGASSAGSCYRKQKYKMLGEKTDPIDAKSLYRMRIGTLVHDDFQTALLKYYNNKIIMTEVEVELEDLNVRGYLDILLIDGKKGDLKDIKTSAAFAWRRKFGLYKNRDPNPSEKYELQIGTYALGAEKKFDIEVVNMDIIYSKKDDSSIRFVNINTDYKEKAKEYWKEVSTVCKQDLKLLEPGEHIGVPFESWECNYCQYKSICPSPFIKKGK